MSRADILDCCTLQTTEVALPNGKTVTVRELNAGERGVVVGLFRDKVDFATVHARIVAMAVQEGGKPVFTEKDVPDILKMPGRVVQSLADKALELSAMGDDEGKKE